MDSRDIGQSANVLGVYLQLFGVCLRDSVQFLGTGVQNFRRFKQEC